MTMLTNILLVFLVNLLSPPVSNRINFEITERSSLTLSGSSNVNKFKCVNYENLSDGVIIAESMGRNHVNFSNAVLRIVVTSFDCNNPMLNKDFYKTLNAKKQPTIDVELLSALPLMGEKILSRNKGKLKAAVAITLNGRVRNDEIIVTWQKTSDDLYHFVGSKELKMSDFSIEKPVAALGLIKVNDEITIDFDLYIKALEQKNI